MPESARRMANSFVPLGREISARFRTPVGQFSFWVYLLIGVILFGGIAVWVELLKFVPGFGACPNIESLKTAINAYFPAIGCAAAVQLAFAAENKKYLVSFGYLLTVFFAVLSVVMILLERNPATWVSWLVSSLGCFLAIVMWWIANALDRTYQDLVGPDAALGGPPQAQLPGDISEFQT